MNAPQQLARHLRAVYFGGNWTDVNLKMVLEDVGFEEAISRVKKLHTIAELVFHIDYFIQAVQRVLKGEDINANDKFSFDLPGLETPEDWADLCTNVFANAEALVTSIEELDANRMNEFFVMEKYGTYLYNLSGLTEHTHYHLGQISLLKKYLRS